MVIDCDGDESKVCVWNTRSGAIVSFEKEKYDLISNNMFKSPIVKPLINDLLTQGIIVSTQLNEFNQICFTQKQMQYMTNYNSLNLVIAPTLQCNYRCVYCFENSQEQKTIMSNKTMEGVVAFVENQITHNNSLKELDVAWFGGEPLMAYHSVMRPLANMLIDLCKKYSIEYRSKITTNGFYLEDSIIKEVIDDLKIDSFQITFDGTCQNYCLRKGVTPQSYNKVKHNLFALSQFIFETKSDAHISLRINVDNDNVEDAKNLVKEIRDNPLYHDNIKFYLGHLIGYCGNLNYMSLEEYENSEMDFASFLCETIKPKEPKKIWCGQFTMSSICIGPNGEMYKCEHDFGVKDRIIGTVTDGFFFNEHLMSFLEQPYPQECRDCSIFPICLGGCPSARFLSGENKHCEYTKNYLMKIIENYITNKRR